MMNYGGIPQIAINCYKAHTLPVLNPTAICCAEMVGHGNQVGLIPKCVANISRFTLGVLGLGCVCSTLLLCSPQFATIHNPLQPFATVRGRLKGQE